VIAGNKGKRFELGINQELKSIRLRKRIEGGEAAKSGLVGLWRFVDLWEGKLE
jgi:hypothetical protein